ncbi:MAG: methyl-accepting chemotaxis protein [Opitutaceae bacterium]
MNLSVGRKVSLLTLTAVAILVAFAWVAHQAFQRVGLSNTRVVTIFSALQNHQVADMMHDALRSDVLALNDAARRSDAEALTEAQNDLKEHGEIFLKALADNRALVLSDSVVTELQRVEAPLNRYLKLAAEIGGLAGKNAEGTAAAEAAMPGFKTSFRELEGAMSSVSEALEAEGKRIHEVSLATVNQLNLVFYFGTPLAMAVISLVAFGVSKSIPRPFALIIQELRAATLSNVESASQVSGASQSLASGASQQAASLEETSASLEELSSTTRRNAESAGTARDAARDTLASADIGATQMQAMQTSMEGIRAASLEITKILKTIDEIAFQTNILALNAAVEAARAGDSGAGFAVVAEEVRNLAQRSATAAQETARKIDDCVSKSQQGATASQEVATRFASIQGQIRQLNDLVVEIAAASQEQSSGLTQVSTALSQIDQITQTNAASAEETASAAEEMNAQAESMSASVRRLEALVGGVARGPGAVAEKPASRFEAVDMTQGPGSNHLRSDFASASNRA